MGLARVVPTSEDHREDEIYPAGKTLAVQPPESSSPFHMCTLKDPVPSPHHSLQSAKQSCLHGGVDMPVPPQNGANSGSASLAFM